MSEGPVAGEERAVREAVDRIVAAFADNRVDDYFAAFHPNATFVFHTEDRRLESAEDYRTRLESWMRDDGFRVLRCRTFDTRVQLWNGAAVVSHTVETNLSLRGAETTGLERETIVLVRQDDGRWLAVHEHLSPFTTG